MATFLGLAGIVLPYFAIYCAIRLVASLLLPLWSEYRRNLFTFTVTIILTAAVGMTPWPWGLFASIAGFLLETVYSMLLWCLLWPPILAAVAIFVPSAMDKTKHMITTGVFIYLLTDVLMSRSGSILELVCLLLFCLVMLGCITAAAKELVPSAIETDPGFTSVVLVGLTVLATSLVTASRDGYSSPIGGFLFTPMPAWIFHLPSASTASTLVLDDFAIQEMKVEFASMARMIKILLLVISTLIILVFVMVCWMIKTLKENKDELIDKFVTKATTFAKNSLGPSRYACYGRLFRVLVGSPSRLLTEARKLFS